MNTLETSSASTKVSGHPTASTRLQREPIKAVMPYLKPVFALEGNRVIF